MQKHVLALTILLTANAFTLGACTSSASTPPSLVHSTALGGYPFPAGTAWVYTREEYQQVIGDPYTIITATERITETVVGIDNTALHHKQEATFVSMPPQWWGDFTSANLEWWYQIEGNKIYTSSYKSQQNGFLAYDFPLIVGKSWCPEQPPPANPNCYSMGRRTVKNRTTYTTPVRHFDDCYEISEEYNSGSVIGWFCNGVGVVARKYDHSGSRFGFQDMLIRFTLGQSAPNSK